jgi:hypothetical protein
MGKVAQGSEPRALVPARTYYAVICGVYDLGTQTGGQFGPKPQFLFMFELHTRKGPARDEKGETLTISSWINFYLGSAGKEAHLLKLVNAIERRKLTDAEIKKGYDVEATLGKTLKVQVVHKPNTSGEVKANVDGMMPLDDDDEEPQPTLDQHYFELTPAIIASKQLPENLPEFIANMVKKSNEFSGKKEAKQLVGAGVGADDDEEIPF